MPVLGTLVVMSEPTWSALGIAALLGGLFALDDTAFAQTWFSQPLPAALLTGLALGDPAAGLALGVPLQLVLVANLPVGQSFTGDAATAVVATVAAAVMAEQSLQPGLVRGIENLPLLGWLLLGAALLSMAGHYVIAAERRANTAWMLQGHRTLRDGNLDRIGRLHLRCLVVTGLRGAAVTVGGALLVLWTWLPQFPHLPLRAAEACGLLAVLLPGLGLGALIERYGARRSFPWFAAGAVVAVAWRLGPW